jgi:dTDP-4-dehydrorhamnose 3,5-epimerase
MNVIKCDLADLLVIEPDVFGDHRGFFAESWNRQRYREAGIDFDFVQDNFSFSRRGTLRGLHFQNPTAQGKLVSVWQGEVWDVAVDLRRASPTFGRWHGVTLSADNKRQFFVPPGFAHGFVVTSDTALFHYKCTAAYSKEHERGFRWNDPALGIQWPVTDPILSTRDAAAPLLQDLPADLLF